MASDAAAVRVQAPPAVPRSAFRHRGFWLLLAVLLTGKLVALFTFGHWPDSDESVVGIMARHIVELGVHPLHYYGQDYGGGGSIEAHIAALFYLLFGMSGYSLKLAALLFTLVGGVMLYALAVRLAGVRAGLFALLIYALMPGLIEWGLKVRGGYVVMLPLVPLMLWLADLMLRSARVHHPAAVALIVAGGVGVWNMQTILPLLAFVAMFILCYWLLRRRFRVFGGYLAYVAVAIAGALLWRRYGGSGVVSAALDWRTLSADQLFRQLGYVAAGVFPDSFQPYIDGVVDGCSWPQAVTFCLFMTAFAWLVWQVVRRSSGQDGRARSCDVNEPRPSARAACRLDRQAGIAHAQLGPLVVLLLLYVPFHLLCSTVASINIYMMPRYFFPLFPVIAILGGLVMACLPRWVWPLVTACLVAAFVTFTGSMIRHPRLYEHLYFYEPAPIRDLASTLDRLGVRNVRTTYNVQWRLLFETRERVTAVNVVPFIRHPLYVTNLLHSVSSPGTKVAYVFERDGVWCREVLNLSPRDFRDRYLIAGGIPFETFEAGPYVIYLTRSPGFAEGETPWVPFFVSQEGKLVMLRFTEGE